MNILFISYNSAIEPLLNSQGIPFMKELSQRGIKFTLLTFERKGWTDKERQKGESLKKELGARGIDWRVIRLRPVFGLPASSFDILVGILVGAWIVLRKHIHIVHARSYIPAAMAIVLKKALGVKFVFDMRGLMPEEYVDEGHWTTDSLAYKLAKKIEKTGLRTADRIVVTTDAFAQVVSQMGEDYGLRKPLPITIIANCTDIKKYKFQSESRNDSLPRKRIHFIYTGSTAKWQLLPEMVDFVSRFKQVRDVFFTILTYGDTDFVQNLLVEKEFARNEYNVVKASSDEVPEYLSRADIGISFIKPSRSKKIASPIKFAEYLLSGLPVVVNPEIGGTDVIVKANRIGVVVEAFSTIEYDRAMLELSTLLENRFETRKRARAVGESLFSLSSAARKYEEIYLSLS